jgi:hypothetical protein
MSGGIFGESRREKSLLNLETIKALKKTKQRKSFSQQP